LFLYSKLPVFLIRLQLHFFLHSCYIFALVLLIFKILGVRQSCVSLIKSFVSFCQWNQQNLILCSCQVWKKILPGILVSFCYFSELWIWLQIHDNLTVARLLPQSQAHWFTGSHSSFGADSFSNHELSPPVCM
jgi:hypothetical protein